MKLQISSFCMNNGIDLAIMSNGGISLSRIAHVRMEANFTTEPMLGRSHVNVTARSSKV